MGQELVSAAYPGSKIGKSFRKRAFDTALVITPHFLKINYNRSVRLICGGVREVE